MTLFIELTPPLEFAYILYIHLKGIVSNLWWIRRNLNMLKFVQEKIVPGYKNYTTSDDGIIYSRATGFPFELSQRLNSSGYLTVGMYTNTKKKVLKMVHRLVAESWLSNPHNYPVVNHIDGNKQNNSVSNLEFVTHKQNTIHASSLGLIKQPSKIIIQIGKDNIIIGEHKSAKDARKKTGVKESNIYNACRIGKNRTAGGFYWRYKDEYIKGMPFLGAHPNSKSVEQYTVTGKFVEKHESITTAAKKIGCSPTVIGSACRGEQKKAAGYVWKYTPTLIFNKTIKNDISKGWKIIPETMNHKISKSGDVYSILTEKILKPFQNLGGYRNIKLTNKLHFSIHRLVAKAYIPNPNNYPLVNHKDGNPSNNTVENLEWCSHSQNSVHAVRIGLNKSSKKVNKIKNRKIIKTYNSITEAAKDVGVTRMAITNVLIGRSKTCVGHEWKYAS